MGMIGAISKAWSWIGLEPVDVITSNAFGNVIVRDKCGRFWRICPEELSCQVVAESEDEYRVLISDEEYLADWDMIQLVALASRKLGSLAPDRCYCLKVPGVLGGEYVAENLGTNSRLEVIAFSGDVAQQLKDVPDGAKIEIRIGQ